MVDVSGKPAARRTATASGRVLMRPETVDLIRKNLLEKGDVLAVARIAGIGAAKRTSDLIPLCHNIAIDRVQVDCRLLEDGVEIVAAAVCTDRTGIEMEALTAVAIAALTIYDMCKAVDRSMRITDIRLLEKTKKAVGGQEGHRASGESGNEGTRDGPLASEVSRGEAIPGRRRAAVDEGPDATAAGDSGRQSLTTEFAVLSVNVSFRKGEKKTPVERGVLIENHGLEGDAHAGNWDRQVSLLAAEDIDTMRGRGIAIGFGDFAENITTRGADLSSLPIGARLHIGDAVLQVTRIGQECHGDTCAIYKAVGDCVMPRRGIFARVLRGGEVSLESRCHYDI
jgi:cyclic pyranopterin monophosphate synthase